MSPIPSQPDTESMPRATRYRARLLAALVTTLTLAVGGLVWWQVERTHDHMRQQVLAQAEQRSLQLADAMAGQMSALLGGIDLALRQLRREWQDSPADFDARARAALDSLPPGAVSHVTVVGADGFVVYNSLGVRQRTYMGDRAHFRAQQGGGDRLVIGKPVMSRLGNAWTFIVNRPILRDGRFAGTLNMSVSSEYLSDKLAALRLSEHDVIALLHADGSFLARSQDFRQAMGKGVPADRPFLAPQAPAQGVFRLPGAMDQTPHIYAWHRPHDYGLITTISLAEASALAPLDVAMARDHLISAGLVALVAVFGVVVALLLLRSAREQTQIAASEAFRQRVFDSSPIPIVVIDAGTFEFLDCNPAATGIYHHASRAETLGKTPLDVSAPLQYDGTPSAEKAIAYIQEAQREGAVTFEWRHQRPNGEIWDAEVNLLSFQAGPRRLLQFTLLDITERKRAERALHDSELRFRQLFEQVPTVAVQGYGSDGTVRYWNQASEVLYGYSREEAMGRNLVDLIIPPALREDVRQAVKRMVQSGETRKAEELELMRKDGSLVPVFSSHVVLESAGSDRELYCLDVDLSQRKADEAMLLRDREQQTILREMLEDVLKGGGLKATLDACLARVLAVTWLALLPKGGIFLMDEDRQTLRLTVARDLSPEILSLCDQVPLGRCHCGQAGASRQMQFSQSVDHRHEISYPGMAEHGHYNLPLLSEGEVLGVMVLYLPHGFEQDPGKEEFLTTVADVLAGFIRRKHAEEALQRLNEELEGRVRLRTVELLAAKEEAEQASLAKSEFLSRMSHELRTPLNAILGFGQLLELGVRDAEQADNVQEIMHAGRHLLELINEVLDLARIEAGHLTVSCEPVSLMSLVEECLTLIRPLAEARRIRVAEGDRDCGKHVLADWVRLKQVLLNLLSNAVKYNREGGEIAVTCAAEGETRQVRVSDTGAGLTAEQQARLFNAFERLDADKTAVEGTGIGLALSKRLVELMHGEIGVDSTPGQGSTFWVRLPATDGHRLPEQADAEAAGAAPAAARGQRREVLCIEDNPANLRLIERILARREDVRLLSAATPRRGLELALAHRPALILLDINLPEMDGFEVMACLQDHPATRHIPVVVISANAMPSDLARGKAAGFADYLTKPLDMDRLMGVMDRLIDPVTSATDSSGG